MSEGQRIGGWPFAVWTTICTAWLIIIWTWGAVHLAMPVDDTFYYFKTALNVAHGLGSTFDGINPTDGYHPLWLAFLALLFKPFGNDMVLLTRIAFTAQVIMIWCGGVLLARLRDTGGAKILWPLVLVLANPFTAKIVLCGQETALQFLLSSAALSLWWTLRESPHGYRPMEWVGLAVLCALATLSRLDTAFFAVAILAMPLVLPSDVEKKGGSTARFCTTALGAIVFGSLIGAFLLYRLATFHHLMPVSGAIKQHLDADEVAPSAARLVALVIAIAATAWTWRAARRRQGALALLAPAVAGAAVVAIYNFTVRGEMAPSLIRIWYLEPYMLVGSLVCGALLAIPGRRLPVVLFDAGAAVWLAFSVFTWQYRFDSRSYSLYAAAERSSRWVDQHSEAGSVGAAWDAGFTAAFTRKPVMNLDGLINSWEFKEKYLDTGKVDDFILRRQPVDFVLQYAWSGTVRAIARRFEHEPLPTAPRVQTGVTGVQDRGVLSGRWGVDLTSFAVARAECVTVSMAYDPRTAGTAYYFVLTRAPIRGRMTLAEFALANKTRTSCEGFGYGPQPGSDVE